MDSFSQSLFASREISVFYKGDKEAVQSFELNLFGFEMQPHDYADLLGMPAGTEVTLDYQVTEFSPVLAIEARLGPFELRAHAAVSENEGNVDFWWHGFVVWDDAPYGLATRIIARQAHCAPRYRVTSLNVLASGAPKGGYVGV